MVVDMASLLKELPTSKRGEPCSKKNKNKSVCYLGIEKERQSSATFTAFLLCSALHILYLLSSHIGLILLSSAYSEEMENDASCAQQRRSV